MTVTILALLLTTCMQNQWTVSFLYNRIDDAMISRIKDHVDLTKDQSLWLEQQSQEFMLWHRHNQLPMFVTMLSEIENKIANNRLDSQAIYNIVDRFKAMIDHSYKQSPFLRADELLITFSDEQVNQLRESIKRKNSKYQEKLQEEKQRDNLERIDKIASRLKKLGIKLNKNQLKIISKALEDYHPDREKRYEQVVSWKQTLLELLKQRKSTNFSKEIAIHMRRYPSLPGNENDQVQIKQNQFNQRLMANTVASVIEQANKTQRLELLSLLQEYGRLIEGISI